MNALDDVLEGICEVIVVRHGHPIILILGIVSVEVANELHVPLDVDGRTCVLQTEVAVPVFKDCSHLVNIHPLFFFQT